MSFTPTTWVEDSEPGISAEQLNRIEQGIVDATATTKTFTEKWQALTIPSVRAWVSVNLSAYGVAAGDTVWITLQFAGNGTLYGGARAVGSSSQRLASREGLFVDRVKENTMSTPLADRDLKNRRAADLQRVKTTVAQAVAQLKTAKTELLAHKADMAKDATLWPAEEQAEVDAIIAWAAGEVNGILQ